MGISKLLFGLRIGYPEYTAEAVDIFDKGLREMVEGIVVCGGPFFGDLQWRLSTLPIRYGGLGLYTAKETSYYAFLASRVQSWGLQDHILMDTGVEGMDDNFHKALEALQATLLDYDFSSLPPHLKHKVSWRVPFLVKWLRTWIEIMSYQTDRKLSLIAYGQHMPKTSF
ncbi:hypothetical protein OROHE_018004 [Orobanche hederae]